MARIPAIVGGLKTHKDCSMKVTFIPLRHRAPLQNLVAIAGFAVLAACATTPSVDSNSASAPYSGPVAPIEGYDWISAFGTQSPMLAYGVANSDDAPLIMRCVAGSGRVSVSVMSGSSQKRAITLSTADLSRSYDATNTYEDMSGGRLLQTVISATDPIFASAEVTGWLAIRPNDTWVALVPHRGTRLDAKAFSTACQ